MIDIRKYKMHNVRIKRWLLACFLLLAGVGLLLAGCDEEGLPSVSDDVGTVTLLLRDSNTGTHYQMEVKLWEIEESDRVQLLQWQVEGVRVTVEVPKSPSLMTNEEKLALVKAAVQAYNNSEEKPSDPVTPDDPGVEPDDPPAVDPVDPNDPPVEPDDPPVVDPDDPPSNEPEPMKVPMTLQLLDAGDGRYYTFTFDAVSLSETEKKLVAEQAQKEALEMELAKDPEDMTDGERKELVDAILALLSYVPPLPPVPIATVYIDAGHGFTNSYGVPDRGTGEGTPYFDLTGKYESDLNLMVAMHLKALLTDAGFSVIMSREGEVNEHLTVNNRVRRVNASDADFCISIHANAASAAAKGARVYWHTSNASASVSKKYAQEVADAINEIGGVTNKAAYVDVGNYAMVRDVHIPAILVETCFLTNEEDALMASDPMWAKRMAEALSLGICSQFAGQ